MKAIYTITLLVTLAVGQAFAQQPYIKSYVEKTHISPKVGTQFGYEFKNNFEAGIFYQAVPEMFETSEANLPRFYEKEFKGIFITGPLAAKNNLELKANVRVGAINREYFAITPSVLAGYTPFKFIEFEAGFGIKSFRITSQAGIKINF